MNPLKRWLTRDGRKTRRQTRWRVDPNTNYFIFAPRAKEIFSVHLCETSSGGFSFLLKNPQLNIGDEVEVRVGSPDEQSVSLRGKIVNQDVYYTERKDDLSSAFFRFSVQLIERIDETKIKRIEHL